ncbi:hypothetical protein K3495_g10235 [Podosphaera aphanis]|nr:hypothetical protein K3495_g10235 [Podosphaera aphanis]
MASSKHTTSPTIKRILREAAELAQSPSPDFHAAPARDSDLFEWHFTLRGPPSSAFATGIYHGRIVLPPTYPLRPPSFRFLNASGRFEVNREICLSISGHHEETWMPAWGVRTALVALRSFMETDARGQLGGLDCTPAERERYAHASVRWRCSVCQQTNEEILNACAAALPDAPLEAAAPPVDTHEPAELTFTVRDDVRPVQPREKSPRNKVDVHGTTSRHRLSFSAEVPKNPPATDSGPTQAPHNHAHLQSQHRPPAVRRAGQDSPLWIDWIITATAICLVLMVIKVLF